MKVSTHQGRREATWVELSLGCELFLDDALFQVVLGRRMSESCSNPKKQPNQEPFRWVMI